MIIMFSIFLSGFCNGVRIGALMKCAVIWGNWQFSGHFRFSSFLCFILVLSIDCLACSWFLTAICILPKFCYKPISHLWQAVWVWTVSLPVTIVNASGRDPSLQAADIIGWIMWSVGITIEASADQQKLSFKNSPENRGKWCNVGVWKYTRHPNYFGEVSATISLNSHFLWN